MAVLISVLTAAGLVAIENIKAGDKVISTNADAFEVAEKTVLETYIRETTELVHLTINGELIKTTYEHPFYVKEHGFVNAGELYIGDKLLDSNGSTLIVEDRKVETIDEPVKVYNFQVEDFHTYYVGNIEILVHNADYPKLPEYEKADYHNKGNSVKSAAPTNGQEALDKSVPIKPETTTRCVSVDGNNFVVFDETSSGVFHGHIRTWSQLTDTMKNALVKSGLANRKGKIL